MANSELVKKLNQKLYWLKTSTMATVAIDEKTIEEILEQFEIDDEDSSEHSLQKYYEGHREGFELGKKCKDVWLCTDYEDPEEEDEYLVLWKSDVSKHLFYGMCEWTNEEGWLVYGMEQAKLYGEHNMEIVYWMELPKMPE